MTSTVAIRPAIAPYAAGPRIRAATMVNAYVVTFISPTERAMSPVPRIMRREWSRPVPVTRRG